MILSSISQKVKYRILKWTATHETTGAKRRQKNVNALDVTSATTSLSIKTMKTKMQFDDVLKWL